eukprot:scaffold6137_cov147-Isochrysis_galbana.AAC.6
MTRYLRHRRRGRALKVSACRRVNHACWEIKVRRIHRGHGNVRRMDRHHNGLVERGRLWILPAVIGTIQRGDGTFTLYRGVAHLELRRRHCNGTGGEDLRIGELRVEAHGTYTWGNYG